LQIQAMVKLIGQRSNGELDYRQTVKRFDLAKGFSMKEDDPFRPNVPESGALIVTRRTVVAGALVGPLAVALGAEGAPDRVTIDYADDRREEIIVSFWPSPISDRRLPEDPAPPFPKFEFRIPSSAFGGVDEFDPKREPLRWVRRERRVPIDKDGNFVVVPSAELSGELCLTTQSLVWSSISRLREVFSIRFCR
jgi:hypothetical protein